MSVKVYRRHEDSPRWTRSKIIIIYILLIFGRWAIMAAVSLTTKFKGCNPQISLEKQNLVTTVIYNLNPLELCHSTTLAVCLTSCWSVRKPGVIPLARQRRWMVGSCGTTGCFRETGQCGGAVEFPTVTRMEASCNHDSVTTTLWGITTLTTQCQRERLRKKNKQKKTTHTRTHARAHVGKIQASGRIQSAANWCNSMRTTGPSDNTGSL